MGFAPAKVLQETITERGEEVKTTELDLCIGVAVGGVQYAPDGSIGNTSVSMFHVLPNVPNPGVEIVRKVMELRNAGFEVSAYVAGSDGQTRPGQSTRSTLEAMLGGMDVPFKSAPHSGGDTSQYLSAKIDEDGRVQYGVEQSEFNWKNFESPSFEDVPTR